MQLPNLRYLDLNMNQIEWDEFGPEFDLEPQEPLRVKIVQYSTLSTFKTSKTIAGGWKILNRVKEGKSLRDGKEIDIRSVEIAVTEEFTIKVMSCKDLYID